MNLDKYGLPVQQDGDANDQLQRCGMIAVASDICKQESELAVNCLNAIRGPLQQANGVYMRYIGGNPNNVSADQLISALATHVVKKDGKRAFAMFTAMCKRFGFAQNYKDGLNDDAKTKLPDLMAIRALPLFARMHKALYPIALIADITLVLSALAAVGPVWRDGGGFKRRDAGDVDDNNTVLTLAVCRVRLPTPLSILACLVFAKLRPWNLGCQEYRRSEQGVEYVVNNARHPVFGALYWYHRAESGGNPEVAEMWRTICERWFS